MLTKSHAEKSQTRVKPTPISFRLYAIHFHHHHSRRQLQLQWQSNSIESVSVGHYSMNIHCTSSMGPTFNPTSSDQLHFRALNFECFKFIHSSSWYLSKLTKLIDLVNRLQLMKSKRVEQGRWQFATLFYAAQLETNWRIKSEKSSIVDN